MASQAPAYWAAIAASAAVIVSGINVFLTARFNRRAELNKWRRDSILPLVADLLGASEQYRTKARHADTHDWGRERQELSRAYGALRLRAPEEVLLPARKLFALHLTIEMVADATERQKRAESILPAEQELIAATQGAVGIEDPRFGRRRRPRTSRPKPPNEKRQSS